MKDKLRALLLLQVELLKEREALIDRLKQLNEALGDGEIPEPTIYWVKRRGPRKK
jgi:hypothetical protein